MVPRRFPAHPNPPNPMNTLRAVGVVLSCALLVPVLSFAQGAPKEVKEKSPEDLAWDEFNKVFDNKEAKPDAARFALLTKTAIDFLVAYPKHRQAGAALTKVAKVRDSMRDRDPKKDLGLKPLRVQWFSTMQLELVNKSFDDSLSPNSRAAVLALDAVIAQSVAYDSPSADSVGEFRKKVDELSKHESGWLFLKDLEVAYYEMMMLVNPKTAVMHVTRLTQSKDKETAKWAKAEESLNEIRKQPYALKFTALDGREVDFEQLRGRVVYMIFYSSTAKRFSDELEPVKDVYAEFSRKDFDVVLVSYDTEKDKAEAFLKEKKIKWPVYFDGKGEDNEFGKKLNVTNRGLPTGVLFDAKGMFVKTNVGMRGVKGDIEKLVAAKNKK